MTCCLAECAVAAHAAIVACEKNIGPRRNVFLHTQFTAEAVHALYKTGFNSGYQCRVWIQCPVGTNFSLQAQLLAIGRQQQLNGCGIKANAMIQSLYAVLCA